MSPIRFVLPMVLFVLLSGFVSAEDDGQRIKITLSPDSLTHNGIDYPADYKLVAQEDYRVCVKPETIVFETIPAVFQEVHDVKILVKPETKIEHRIPAVFKMRTRPMPLYADGELVAKLNELAAKLTRVELVGSFYRCGFKVAAIVEAK